MKKMTKQIGLVAACLAVACMLTGCSKAPETAEKAKPAKAGIVQQAPWMDGERWGMTPAEVRIRLGKEPELESKTSYYYPAEFEGRAAMSQYVFAQGAKEGERMLVRKIVYLAHPKREAFLPAMSRVQAEEAFGTVRSSMEAVFGKTATVIQPMAVSVKLESHARAVGDRVKAAEKEVRKLERQIESRRRELQRQYAGQKNRNAMVAAGLTDFDKPLLQAQRNLAAVKDEQGQVLKDIRTECEALPEEERPFHWECNWTVADGSASLYLTANVDRTHLALSFEAPE
jgi:hypothetical protein